MAVLTLALLFVQHNLGMAAGHFGPDSASIVDTSRHPERENPWVRSHREAGHEVCICFPHVHPGVRARAAVACSPPAAPGALADDGRVTARRHGPGAAAPR